MESGGLTDEFRVALKPSACEAAAWVADLRDEAGEVVSFDSRDEAERALLEGPDAAGLRLQRPAPNDPAAVDAYLVWVREPAPEPAERGPPAEGWAVDVRGQQVGAMTEALFDAYRWNPPPIRAYAARELGLDVEELVVEVDHDPESVSVADLGDGGGMGSGTDAGTGSGKDVGTGSWTDDGEGDVEGAVDGADGEEAIEGDRPEAGSNGDGSAGTWVPDVEFVVRRAADGARDDGRVYRRYLAEIKHGSASFERSQRRVMERLAEQAGPGLDVLVIRVELDDVPQSVDVAIRSL